MSGPAVNVVFFVWDDSLFEPGVVNVLDTDAKSELSAKTASAGPPAHCDHHGPRCQRTRRLWTKGQRTRRHALATFALIFSKAK